MVNRPKNRQKTFNMRCTEEFLAKLEELADAIGESKTAAVELAVDMFFVPKEDKEDE